jgi:carboxylate-amine ligase
MSERDEPITGLGKVVAPIRPKHSPNRWDGRTVGVEEEFLLVRGRGELADDGDEVVRDAAGRDPDGQFEHELKQAQAELGSSPASDLDALEADLRRLRREFVTAAADTGARLIASGTHPSARHPATTADQRYRRMTEAFGLVARQQLTCGMHVHVSVDSPEEGVAVIDRVQRWLPLLTALSANSPFHHGEDTDYASYRSVLWGQWPTAGPTAPFGDLDTYRRTQQALLDTGAALDDGMLYFDIRLSANYPTVELRVADVNHDVGTAILIAALGRALVDTAARAWRDGVSRSAERIEALRASAWRAARWGMAGKLVDVADQPAQRPQLRPAWECVETLLSHVADSLAGSGDVERVRHELRRLRERGTGADEQRAAHRTGGFDAVLDALTVRG